MSLFEKVVDDLRAAESSMNETLKATQDYQAACIAGEWDKLETIRLRAIASLESFFDNQTAAYRAVARNNGNGS